ncbi:DUF6397 family protein [Streptomyces sp. NPDC096198]|uniref:DUF6397 family protein n=1 Tax=Streptomyces sp. NPDC096198 TaxID=3366080 RepID=UPI003810D134
MPTGAAREPHFGRGGLDPTGRLGRARTVPDEGGGSRPRSASGCVWAEGGFPDALREGDEAVGTGDGAALMGVTPGKFTRFARLGLVSPVAWYVNRYRVVVWLYLTEEVRQFATAEENALLLTGRTPEALRGLLEAGVDLRPRNWRGRHIGLALRQEEDPWVKAAVLASPLDPARITEVVRDPHERVHLEHLKPVTRWLPTPGSPTASIAARIIMAQDPDEIDWLRAELAQTLIEARRHCPAPGAHHARPTLPACSRPASGEGGSSSPGRRLRPGFSVPAGTVVPWRRHARTSAWAAPASCGAAAAPGTDTRRTP